MYIKLFTQMANKIFFSIKIAGFFSLPKFINMNTQPVYMHL